MQSLRRKFVCTTLVDVRLRAVVIALVETLQWCLNEASNIF